METHNTSLRIEATDPSRDGCAAAGYAVATETACGPTQTVFQWQALLMRDLPDPIGPSHSVKRFALR
jgi:hypothetical protein